jgi:hypothetical protein
MFLIILSLFFYFNEASASICDSIFKTSDIGCSDEWAANSAGGSYPLLFDAFNFNPAALPTYPTPFGVEAYYNSNNKKVNFALLKGAEDLGFGASSKKSDTTFFSGSENYKVKLQKTKASYRAASLDQFLNLGTAYNLINIPDLGALPLGLGYRYNPETKKWTFQPGFEIRTASFSLGVSYNKETPDKYFDTYYEIQEEIENLSINASLKIMDLLIGYSNIQQSNKTKYTQEFAGNNIVLNTDYKVITQIISGTLIIDSLSLTSAYRSQKNSQIQSAYSGTKISNNHFLAGASFKTNIVEIGAFYNYVLNEDVSCLVKIFF